MEPQQPSVRSHKLAEQRLKITPDGDKPDLSVYEPGSDQSDDDLEQNNSDEEQRSHILKDISVHQKQYLENQVPALQIVDKLNKPQRKQKQQREQKQENQQKEVEQQKSQKQAQQNQQQEPNEQISKQKLQESNKVQQQRQQRWSDVEDNTENKNKQGVKNNQQSNNDGKQQLLPQSTGYRQYKVYDHPVDSKYISALYLLFLDQIRKFIPYKEGYIKCNPRINHKTIKIGYYDQQILNQGLKKLELFIEDIEVLEVPKKDAESGITLSYKYRDLLKKQKLAIFNDESSKHRGQNTYICGIIPKKELLLKLNQMRKINFTWLHLFKFPDTRSYRKIMRIIFEQPQIKQLVKQKFNAREIEVTLHQHNSLSNHSNTKKLQGVTVILTIVSQKKLTIHQEIEEILTKFINDTYYLFCFSFVREKFNEFKRYVPNIQNVVIFYIHEKHISFSYIFFLVKKYHYSKQLSEIILKQLMDLKLNIKGTRFFRNFQPELPTYLEKQGYNMFKYPKYLPYSWTVTCSNSNKKFDPARFLKL